MLINLTSLETGEVLDSFEVDDEEFASWEASAKKLNLTVEEFIQQALRAALDTWEK